MSVRTRLVLAARALRWAGRGRVCARGVLRACLSIVAALGVYAHVSAQGVESVELFVNGDLSDGPTGWRLATTDDGNPDNGTATWFLANIGEPTPLSGLETSAEGNAQGMYLVTDQQIQSRLAVFQTITIPSANSYQSIRLSFDMYVNDYANIADLDPNQYVTVDLMPGDADPLDISGSAIYNVYTGTDGGPLPNPFLHHRYDITGWVEPGQDYMVRFLANVNLSVLNVGVDNVSVVAVVPEPGGLVAMASCGMFLAHVARRRRRR